MNNDTKKNAIITVKAYAGDKFEIALVELREGYYRVVYTVMDSTYSSEAIKDFATASFMFDHKLAELEGH